VCAWFELGRLLTTTGKSICKLSCMGTTSSAGARHSAMSAPAPTADTSSPSGSWYCWCVTAPSMATVAFAGVLPAVSEAVYELGYRSSSVSACGEILPWGKPSFGRLAGGVAASALSMSASMPASTLAR
jgi:hypothetical protein